MITVPVLVLHYKINYAVIGARLFRRRNFLGENGEQSDSQHRNYQYLNQPFHLSLLSLKMIFG